MVDGDVVTRQLPELGTQLRLIEVRENWSEIKLVSWLDRNIPHSRLDADVARAWLNAVITEMQKQTPLGRLVRERFELRRTPPGYAIVRELDLLTAKKVFYVANVSEGQLAAGLEDPIVAKLVAKVGPKVQVVVICAAIEAEIAALEPADRAEFLAGIGLAEPGLDKLIRTAYDLLDLITYFTAGVKECRAWTIKRGTKAPQAAGVIHSDFERGFIRAEVIDWKVLVDLGSEAAVKAAGKLRVEGKEYVVRDGDVMHFRFNV